MATDLCKESSLVGFSNSGAEWESTSFAAFSGGHAICNVRYAVCGRKCVVGGVGVGGLSLLSAEVDGRCAVRGGGQRHN